MNMIDYIWQQPDLFTAALKDRRNIAKGFVDALVNGSPDCIYLVASGTSHNACLAARKFMQDILQVPVTVLPSSRSGAYFSFNTQSVFRKNF